MSSLTELRTFLADTARRCRAQRLFGAAFNTDVAADIAADVATEQAAAAREAHAAEVEDLEAAKILEAAARDGLTVCDMPAVAKAVRLIRRSARRDHAIAEANHA